MEIYGDCSIIDNNYKKNDKPTPLSDIMVAD